jgi:hypothetical protein
MTITPSLLLLGAQLVVPISDQVPTLDVTASCKAASSISVAESQSYEACIKDENDARAQLRQSWPSFSAAERTRCSAEASMGGPASYVDLLVCLEITRDAAAAEKIKLKGARKKR